MHIRGDYFPKIRIICSVFCPIPTSMPIKMKCEVGGKANGRLFHAPHVQGLARRCFYHLRQLRSVRRSLTIDSAKTLVHALIASCLDYYYCNSVLHQINTTATKTLQSVLHSAARLIVRKRKFERITPTLRDDLHWLPVRERIVFKIRSIILNVSPTNRTAVPPGAVRTRYSSYKSPPPTLCRSWRSASASLPPSLRDPTLTLTLFCSWLKTYLFGLAYGRALVTA